jgi:hypothetical protein
MIEPPQHITFHEYAETTHNQRGEDESHPVIDAQIGEAHPCYDGSQHVLGTMREVNNVEKPENDGEAQAQDSVERSIDEADKKLPKQCLNRNIKYVSHRSPPYIFAIISKPTSSPVCRYSAQVTCMPLHREWCGGLYSSPRDLLIRTAS